ncbi:phosphatase PAP2 family protein [Actinomadura syzygii]|uniref:Phosphatase PAP2 family protein n=1 Tax=Actinomadura syzygii TaxID=1427538 RepID=A0A5D0U2D1_9ACTN|nr:phosphatase PAP2 family protein [Actinomadura syzygii]
MGWRSYGSLAAVMVLVTLDVVVDGPLRQLDHAVHEFCDAHVRGRALEFVRGVSKLGQRGYLVRVIVPLSVVAAVRRRSLRYPAFAVLIAYALSLTQTGLKSVVPRSFPFGDVDVIGRYGDAYPSGHTLNGFVLVWVILELLAAALPAVDGVLPARRRRGAALAAGVVTAAALTVSDQHWLTDVLFSLALGPVLLAWLVAAAPFERRRLLPAPLRSAARATRTEAPRPGPERGR